MVARAVDGLVASDVVDLVVVAAPPGAVDVMRSALDGRAALVVDGGADRVASVGAALREVPDDASVILVHDAARCLCPPGVVRAVVAAVRDGNDAVVPATPVVDTLKRVEDARVAATVDRDGLVGVQTPQGFDATLLRGVHARAEADVRAGEPVPVTDDAGLVERGGGTVAVVAGDPRTFKITTSLDLAMAEALVAAGTA